jgi:anti-sigma factor RsiW
MGDCRRAGERLTPYVDGELPPGERVELDQHLERCPPCRTAANQEQGARVVLRECADRLREPLPPGLRSRCEALAREQARVRAVSSWRARLVPATLVAMLALFAAVAILSLATRRSTALLAAQLTVDHVKCFEAFVPAGTADADAVSEQLESNYGWDIHVPPSSEQAGVSLLGGRRCLYAEGTMPHLMYRSASNEPVSLFRLDGEGRDPGELVAMGHRSQIWSRGGHTYVLVGPASAGDEMGRIARYMQAEAR